MKLEDYCSRIQTQYENSKGDSTQLFQTIRAVADKIGWDEALACLEECVTQKRLLWLADHLTDLAETENPVLAGYRWFYEVYLGISVPADGEIVEQTGQRMVLRWWNHCPTLEACRKLGLDTRQVCRKAYQKPVQAFLSKIHPGLKFERNYETIRPYGDYCEEIITLTDWIVEKLVRHPYA